MLLFFDTETTGKANFNVPPDHPSQPRLVQLACELYTLDGTRPLHTLSVIIKPEGFTIPEETSKIHGITQDIANAIGVKQSWAVNTFLGMMSHAKYFIAHNVSFDTLIMLKEFHVAGKWTITSPNPFTSTFCTMQTATNVCKLPGNYGKYKWPKLSEAYKYAFNEDLQHAHDALVDVRACKRVYDWLSTKQLTPTSKPV
jgi:DNA polymerase III epsilon subunit-like protein